MWSRDFMYHTFHTHIPGNICEETAYFGEEEEEVEELEAIDFFSLYPNPADLYVILNNEYQEACTYQLTDILGTVLQSGASPLGSTHINIGSLPTGTYYIRIYQASTFLGSLMFIKQ